jgi:hypothetical protein
MMDSIAAFKAEILDNTNPLPIRLNLRKPPRPIPVAANLIQNPAWNV